MSKQFYTPHQENMEGPSQQKAKLPLFISLLNVLIAPKKVFFALIDNGFSFWLPLLMLLAFNFGFLFIYFDTVAPVEFLTDLMKTSPDLDSTGNFDVLLVNFEFVKYLFIFMYSAALIISFLLSAWVFYIISNIVSYKNISFVSWLACVSWANLPMVIASIVQIGLFYGYGANDRFFSIDDLKVPNLNSLIVHLEVTDLGYDLLMKIQPFYIWVLFLSVFGFKQMTQSNWLKSSLPVIAVIAVTFGLSVIIG
ncbi:YIP1 family protein [Marinicellulosiphila megalodicopiae]|uniref:YIP1 family protein n=1 Tax=Marinicellulosiphila megalodicopiae TaxID=2724896 RepID=UPI003BB056F4